MKPCETSSRRPTQRGQILSGGRAKSIRRNGGTHGESRGIGLQGELPGLEAPRPLNDGGSQSSAAAGSPEVKDTKALNVERDSESGSTHIGRGLDPRTSEPFQPLGSHPTQGTSPSQATQIYRIALEQYRVGLSASGEPFAVPLRGPNIARPLRGWGALKGELAAEYVRRYGRCATNSAFQDALLTIEGAAQQSSPEVLPLRRANYQEAMWIDLGTPDGAAVRMTPDGWTLESCAPFPFRRTELTGAFPTPQRGGDFLRFRDFMNAADSNWGVIAGWSVASYFQNIPRPALIFTGPQGVVKSVSSRLMVAMSDPTSGKRGELHRPPRNEEEWVSLTTGSDVIGIDNISSLPQWLQDAICRAITGDSTAKRRLYTDNDRAVYSFQRAIILNGIALPGLRGDLLDRSILVELTAPRTRRLEEELFPEFNAAWPMLFGGLLDLIVATMRELPRAQVDNPPRMADFARILLGLDRATGWDTYSCYRRLVARALQDSLEGDPVAASIIALVNERGTWEGRASELLTLLTPKRPPSGWPQTPQHLSARLKLALPALRQVGIEALLSRNGNGSLITLCPSHDARRDEEDGSKGEIVMCAAEALAASDGDDGDDGEIREDSSH